MKRCPMCGELKEMSEFNKDIKRCDGVQTYCRECAKKYVKKYDYVHRMGIRRKLEDAPDCGSYLGVYVAERILSHYFEDITRMPYGHIGYDFICKKGYKIDVKSGCLGVQKNIKKSPRWTFAINKNTIADYFLILAFDNRTDLNPQHIWLIPGEKINHRILIGIANVDYVLKKWEPYEKPLDKVLACCNILRNTEPTH